MYSINLKFYLVSCSDSLEYTFLHIPNSSPRSSQSRDALSFCVRNDCYRGTFRELRVYQLKIDPETAALIEETSLADAPQYSSSQKSSPL